MIFALFPARLPAFLDLNSERVVWSLISPDMLCYARFSNSTFALCSSNLTSSDRLLFFYFIFQIYTPYGGNRLIRSIYLSLFCFVWYHIFMRRFFYSKKVVECICWNVGIATKQIKHYFNSSSKSWNQHCFKQCKFDPHLVLCYSDLMPDEIKPVIIHLTISFEITGRSKTVWKNRVIFINMKTTKGKSLEGTKKTELILKYL